MAQPNQNVPFGKVGEDSPPPKKKLRLSPATKTVIEVASRSSDASARYDSKVDVREDVEGNVSGVQETTVTGEARQSISHMGATLTAELSETVTCVKEVAAPQEEPEAETEEADQPEAVASTSKEETATREEEEEYEDYPEEDVGPPSPPSFTPETAEDIKEALAGLDPPPRRFDISTEELRDLMSKEYDEQKLDKLRAWWENVPKPTFPPINYIVNAKDTIDPNLRWD